jgi:hypothetical protein
MIRFALCGLTLVTCLGWASGNVAAAERNIAVSLNDLLDEVIDTLGQAGFTIHDSASTNRFGLVYAKPADGSFVTVVMRELPSEEPRVHIIVTTDSPQDTFLEQTLLSQITEASTSN